MNALGVLLKYELLQLARDTRMILLAVVLPFVLLPALLLVGRVTDRADVERVRDSEIGLRVTGPDSAFADALIRRAVQVPDSLVGDPLRIVDFTGPAADSLLGAGGLQVVVEGQGPNERGLPRLEVRYRASSDLSRSAADRLEERLERVRRDMRDSMFAAGGLRGDPTDVYPVRTTNVAAAGREAGALLGLIMFPLLVGMMLAGGSLVAADTLSGEKERGTLETLLTSSLSKNEIIVAKGLAIMLVALLMTVVNLTNLGIWIGLGLMEVPGELDVALSVSKLIGMFVLVLPVVVLLSSAMLLISGWARSYREYQLYFPLVFLLALLPSAAPALPGLELRSAVVLLPVANVALALRDLLAGRGDLLFAALAMVVTTGAAAVMAVWARGTLSTERLLGDSAADRAEFAGGPALFPYRVVRWFALMWVALLGISLALGDRLPIQGQVLVNLVGLFLGGSILMIRRYRLPLRQTLALRGVHPVVWLAVLVGAPCGFLAGIGVAEITGRFLPVPPQMLEAFGQFLLPEGMGVVQLVLLLAVLPGITEEIAFRGLLLHGLHRRLKPWALCLVVGLVFGVFHVSLFRILPTAYLGIVLTLVTILTGSIFPAMLWHALNNAVALVPVAMGWVGPDATIPDWALPAGILGLLVSLYVMRRFGRGYPGVTRPPDSTS